MVNRRNWFLFRIQKQHTYKRSNNIAYKKKMNNLKVGMFINELDYYQLISVMTIFPYFYPNSFQLHCGKHRC